MLGTESKFTKVGDLRVTNLIFLGLHLFSLLHKINNKMKHHLVSVFIKVVDLWESFVHFFIIVFKGMDTR